MRTLQLRSSSAYGQKTRQHFEIVENTKQAAAELYRCMKHIILEISPSLYSFCVCQCKIDFSKIRMENNNTTVRLHISV